MAGKKYLQAVASFAKEIFSIKIQSRCRQNWHLFLFPIKPEKTRRTKRFWDAPKSIFFFLLMTLIRCHFNSHLVEVSLLNSFSLLNKQRRRQSKKNGALMCTFLEKFGKILSGKTPSYLVTFGPKVEKILKGSLDSIPSPSPSVKIQILGGKVCLIT